MRILHKSVKFYIAGNSVTEMIGNLVNILLTKSFNSLTYYYHLIYANIYVPSINSTLIVNTGRGENKDLTEKLPHLN